VSPGSQRFGWASAGAILVYLAAARVQRLVAS